jgi:pimeloyl-ACP methyl ester carboxylesterase
VCPGRVWWAAAGDALRVFESFALAPVLSQLSVPLLVLHGEDDRLGPWDAEQPRRRH